MYTVNSIGVVKSKFKKMADPSEMRKYESVIIIKPEFEEGLYKIENNDYLQVVFFFHLSEGYKLKGKRCHGKVRGVFASRSPKRPVPIGITTVKLIEREGRKLWVKGLDAITDTPVIDLKPYSAVIDETARFDNNRNRTGFEIFSADPRAEINSLIEEDNIERLLEKAGEIHGHYCPGLALGVKAATYSIKKLSLRSQGMEDVLAIIETNSCFADGIQYVSGCTFGNNALIYRDYGKTAVTITDRKKNGLRLYAKNINYIQENHPETSKLFEKVVTERKGTEQDRKLLNKRWREVSFAIIKLPVEKLFKIEEVKPEIPEYAPIFKDEFCARCGEKIMAPKAVKEEDRILCKACAGSDYLQLDGSGLRKINSKQGGF